MKKNKKQEQEKTNKLFFSEKYHKHIIETTFKQDNLPIIKEIVMDLKKK